MIIKGQKTSSVVNSVLLDLYALKKPNAVKYFRKKSNPAAPFEDATSLELFSSKCDASLFIYGSHTKKRPNNLIIGRFFDHHLLDMMEFAITNYKPIGSFQADKLPMLGSKPCFTIVGSQFQMEENYRMAANLVVDFFRGTVVDQMNLAGLDHVISLTVGTTPNTILFRHYSIILKKSGSRVPKVELEEVGPSIDLVLRRQRIGAEILRKTALMVPKGLTVKNKKNVTTNAMREQVGTVHVNKQNLDNLDKRTRRPKALREASKRKREEADQAGSPSPKKAKLDE